MRIETFETIDSTNLELKRRDKLEAFDTIIAREQTLGRGRRGNPWSTSKGAGLFSFALPVDLSMDLVEYTKLPLVVGISLLNTLKRFSNKEFLFKWTNDIYVNERKISGILVEKIGDFFIIGIGVNINNPTLTELAHKGISLSEVEGGKEFSIDDIIISIIKDFKSFYSRFLDGRWPELLKEINDYNYLYNKNVKIHIQDNIQRGVAKEIMPDGNLAILIGYEIKSFNIGEVHLDFKV